MLTMEKIIADVRALAAKYPNAVYSSDGQCCYTMGAVENGPEKCGCIFGQVLTENGIDIKEVEVRGVFKYAVEGIGHMPTIIPLIEAKIPDICIEIKEQDWCGAVQRHQDAGRTWGQAVEYADRFFGRQK